MIFKATTINNEELDFISPYRLKMCKNLDTPCDSLYAEFLLFEPIGELETISAFNGDKLEFFGKVDEQKVELSSAGLIMSVSARSNSYLIDNEANPTTYTRPSLGDIYKNHLKPFGIKGVLGNGICQGDFSVSKGTCHWAVVDEFCRCVLNVCPQITSDGYLDAQNAFLNDEVIKFHSNEFFKASLKYKRYGVIGKINYKSDKAEDYKNAIYNSEAKSRNIETERYLNLTDSPLWKRQYRLHRAFTNSLNGSFEIEIEVPFDSVIETGTTAEFSNKCLGEFKNLCVCEVKREIYNSKKICKVTLIPQAHIV